MSFVVTRLLLFIYFFFFWDGLFFLCMYWSVDKVVMSLKGTVRVTGNSRVD